MKKQRKSGRSGKRSWFRRILKILLVIVILVCLLLGAASIYVYYKGNDLLKEYLVTTVDKSSKGVYHLKLQRLNINLLTGRISLSGFHLMPDTAAYTLRSKTDTLSPVLIDARISKFVVRGFSVKEILTNRKIDISKILINSPELTIILKKASKKAEKHASNPKMLSIPLPKGLESLRIREINLEKGKLTIDDQTKQPPEKFIVPSISISFENLLVDSTHTGMRRILNTDDIRISLKGIQVKSKNGMYTITPGEISLSTGKSTLSVTNLKITPNYSRDDFGRKLGYQMDRMDISIGKILMEGLNMRQLLINRQFNAGSVLVDGLVLDDYRDKRVPERPDFKPPLPQQALLASKGYIKIDKVKLTNGKVTYSEQVGDEPGSIFFDKMEGSVENITNDSLLVQKNTIMKVNASMYLMGKGLLKAGIDIPLGAKNDAFTFSATMSKLDLREVNPMLTKLFPAEIISGNAEKLVMTDVKADDDKAVGRMDFYYKDLQIKMDAVKQTTWNKIKSGAISWAANVYVKNENPKNGKFTQGIIYFERNKHKSLFNFLWKSTFSGLKSTMGINKKEQKEMKKAGKNKK
jgi:hypothetical protein